ncbi:error-prone DNA polymerase [Aquisalimonas asiatica]|uniref:Error-prone DNA polymerase n=1 Tax=Aquisalimonas asiatica TaxID=406100 RepID=A0A1H8RZ23_9GAMM|nr:error-prone DNA polymerase [Aquisalimonas asiatica]SEO71526.1 error-prone DNA polymerase, DnaE-like [Aquisalimonas asiatica]
MAYTELHCITNFTFLRGASHPEELVARAAELGYDGLAITDECSVAGAVRAHGAARGHGLQLIIGSEIRLADGPVVVLIAPHRQAYSQLSALISLGRTSAPKGSYRLHRSDLEQSVPDCLALLIPETPATPEHAAWFGAHFRGRGWIAVHLHNGPDDAARLAELNHLATCSGLPLVAAGGVHMHRRGRRALQDTLTAIRHNRPVQELGYALMSNGERHLRPLRRLQRLYPDALLAETHHIAAQCTFSLDELRYEYPEELVPPGSTPAAHLRALVTDGARRRWPGGTPAHVDALLERELALIAELRYEAYFLTVHDVVAFARSRGILCQGRGSAANSAVCFALGVTEVDPADSQLLFERFISRDRGEPPDIDVDFEHERREEVIQYIYRKYGRHRAALAATVISYRPRSALRDVGRALGLEPDQTERLAGAVQWWDGSDIAPDRIREAGFDPDNPVIHRVLTLTRELLGFPRHLSQHVGGFVISRGPLAELVPTENAAMEGRSVIQWDKDDLESLGLLKVDVLALGMLSAIRRAFHLLEHHYGITRTMADIPRNDDPYFAMLQRGDSMGVFQVESRAQMAMLPRLKPECFYDLVIEVAIVRPGPIQGDMVHPYLQRRDAPEQANYPSPEVEDVLKRTLGVPIFQEQVMKLAEVAAGFTPDEADQLRRSMAAWRKRGGLGHFEQRLHDGMRANGYSDAFAARIFRQIQGFGEYGFPESHAASFALLVCVSAWLKCHYPAVFTCALLNSQPMGFYAPAQLVRDAREHGVAVRPVDVTTSQWDCTLEPTAGDQALRLGLRMVKGLSRDGADRLIAARDTAALRTVEDLAHRAELGQRDLSALANAGALEPLSGHRRNAWWQVLGVDREHPLVARAGHGDDTPPLERPSTGEDLIADYGSTGLTLGPHPVALLREQLQRRRFRSAADLNTLDNAPVARAAGIVTNRQRPGSAGGVTFVTLEDETGTINVVVWRRLAEAQRRVLLGARLLGVVGQWERRNGVCHLIAGRLEDHSALLGGLQTRSRDFH